jgi:demethylmenaquinone methyltransferase/2-methoxy-6-polyprenyl-1,4-benzoquinol methylase
MLAVGREKIEAQGLAARISLEVGDAQALPFADDTFDGVTIAFGIRNVPDRQRALAEMARVVRPGGRVCILELGEPDSALARLHVHHIVPRLGALLSGSRRVSLPADVDRGLPAGPRVLRTPAVSGARRRRGRPAVHGRRAHLRRARAGPLRRVPPVRGGIPAAPAA